MKIVLNTYKENILKKFKELGRSRNIEIISLNNENDLFKEILLNDNIDGYVLSNRFNYTQRVVDFIRKKQPYVPIIVYTTNYSKIESVDIQMPEFELVQLDMTKNPLEFLFDITIQNILNYNKTFDRLQKITSPNLDIITFGDYQYDPIHRNFSYITGNLIKKLTIKEGGILEILAVNFKTVVHKEIILEKVWSNPDYYSSRSMDVYITNLRKLLKTHKVNLKIENILKQGLILG